MAKSMLTFVAAATLVPELGAKHAFISEPFPSKPALSHFRHYAGREERISYDGNLEGPFAGHGFHPTVGSFEQLVVKVNKHTDRQCGEGQRTWTLLSAAYDGEGAQHAVLKTTEGHWQYVVLQDEQLLVADPPLCVQRGRQHSIAAAAEMWRRRLTSQPMSQPTSNSHIDESLLEKKLEEEPFTPAGSGEELLDPADDHLVQDCAMTFNRVAKNHCGESSQINLWGVSVGKLQVIDGFVVRLHADIHDDANGKENRNRIVECAYEEPEFSGELERMEPAAEAAQQTDMERRGLIARIRMYVDICEAATDAPDPSNLAIRRLDGTRRLGELSRYRGHKHVYDKVPKFFDLNGVMQLESLALPSSVSLRESYPKCFPGLGKDVVRNQGTCGSCWAFAAASAMMNNLCIAGATEATMANAQKRHEVSVQRILTCNPEGMGCDGGHAIAAWHALKTGIAQEGKVPYQCGGGDPQDHFTVKTARCDAFPWGDDSKSSCAAEVADPNWVFDGLYKVSGEQEMMTAVALGYTLFISVDVTEGLMYYKNPSVYTPQPSDHVIGGHAMVITGYGSYQGVSYWWVQNSWGTEWNEKGFVKLARGINALGAEEGAEVFRGWPAGVEPPSPKIGLKEHGNPYLNKLEPVANKMGTDAVTLAMGLGGLVVVGIVIFFGISMVGGSRQPQPHQQYGAAPMY